MDASDVKKELRKRIKPGKAKLLAGFFKTGKGEYGEGDKFLGVMVPDSREAAKKFKDLRIEEVKKLLSSGYHEERLTALLILVQKYEKGSEDEKKRIFDFYLSNARYINNWDLVDLTAHRIVGHYLLGKDRKLLYRLAASKGLWERRISIISTAAFIAKKDFADTIKISEILLNDKHDLIQKAVGWMLREIGKRDEKTLTKFLDKHSKKMPRTMLRYSIERLTSAQRKRYMAK